jgi:hypothetical protein
MRKEESWNVGLVAAKASVCMVLKNKATLWLRRDGWTKPLPVCGESAMSALAAGRPSCIWSITIQRYGTLTMTVPPAGCVQHYR